MLSTLHFTPVGFTALQAMGSCHVETMPIWYSYKLAKNVSNAAQHVNI